MHNWQTLAMAARLHDERRTRASLERYEILRPLAGGTRMSTRTSAAIRGYLSDLRTESIRPQAVTDCCITCCPGVETA